MKLPVSSTALSGRAALSGRLHPARRLRRSGDRDCVKSTRGARLFDMFRHAAGEALRSRSCDARRATSSVRAARRLISAACRSPRCDRGVVLHNLAPGELAPGEHAREAHLPCRIGRSIDPCSRGAIAPHLRPGPALAMVRYCEGHFFSMAGQGSWLASWRAPGRALDARSRRERHARNLLF
jgi:hypothetical protein